MNVQYAKEVTELPAGSGGKAETLLMRLIRAGPQFGESGKFYPEYDLELGTIY